MTWVAVVLRRDLAVVTLMAIAMTLSAFSVYQATRAADEADARFGQARFVEIEVTRVSGMLQTIVANDSAVMAQLCASTLDSEASVAQLLNVTPDIERVVTSTIELEGLRPLIRGDRTAECTETVGSAAGTTTPYKVEGVLSGVAGEESITALTARAAQLRAEAEALHAQERVLISLGLLFIALLAGLIIVDQLQDRRGRPARWRGRAVPRWRAWIVIGCAVLGLLGAVALLVWAVDRAATALVLAALALAAFGVWLWVRLRGPGAGTGAAKPRWWAEVLGAFALVSFATAAVALSVVSIADREATARADALTAAAERLQESGLQEAARGLAALTSYAGAESAAIAAAQLAEIGLTDDADESGWAARRDEIDRRLTVLEEVLRAGVGEQTESVTTELCAETPPEGLATAIAPSTLYDELSDPDYLGFYVSKTQWPTRVCDAAAALTRQEVSAWGEHKSTLTVALVILGLSGFMLGLASGKSRTRRASIVLLIVGAAGVVTGLGLTSSTLPDALWRHTLPTQAQVRTLATTTATAQTDCTLDPAPLEQALGEYPRYGTGSAALGYARWCRGAITDGWTLLGAEIDEDALRLTVEALREAERLGPVTPTLAGDLGFALIQRGLLSGDADTVDEGLARTDDALAAFESTDATGSSIPHTLRMNRAMALAARGDYAAALQAYDRARACLFGQEGRARTCPGGAIADPEVSGSVLAWALADLELLAGIVDEKRLDAYRLRIVGDVDASASGLAGAGLDVYPQELQVAAHGESTPVEGTGAVVWYHRASSNHMWSVIADPTRRTVHSGAHLGHPLATDMLLPSGQYRADVYANGVRTELHLDGGFRTTEDAQRYASRRMGLSIVVPDTWLESWDTGVHWHVGPTDWTGLSVRRVEFTDAEWDTDTFLAAELDTWVDVEFATNGVAGTDVDDWFLGLDPLVVREYTLPDGSLVRAAAGLSEYGSDIGCGSALVMAGIGGADVTDADRDLLREIVLTRPTPRVAPISGRVERETFAIDVPEGWDAAVRPSGGSGNLLLAKDCGTAAANVLLSQENVDASEFDLAAYVDDVIADYGVPEEYPAFELLERAPIAVAGADTAERIRYTWHPDGGDEVTQVQVYALSGETLSYLTVTVWTDYWQDYVADVELLASTLDVR